MARAHPSSTSRSAFRRHETGTAGSGMSTCSGYAPIQLSHQEDDSTTVMRRPARVGALHTHRHGTPPPGHRLQHHLGGFAGSLCQFQDRLPEPLNWKPDVEGKEILPLHFVLPEPPEIGGDIVPEL